MNKNDNIEDHILKAMRREVPFAHVMLIFCIQRVMHRLGDLTIKEADELEGMFSPLTVGVRSLVGGVKNLQP